MKYKIKSYILIVYFITFLITIFSVFYFVSRSNIKNKEKEIDNLIIILKKVEEPLNYNKKFDIKIDDSNLELNEFFKTDSKISKVFKNDINNKNYILSLEYNNFLKTFNKYYNLTIFLILIYIILATYLVKSTSNIFKNLDTLIENFDQFFSDSYNNYDEEEISLLQNKVNVLSNKIGNEIKKINFDREKLRFVLNNMNQGIIVIDESKQVLLINDYALNIFNYKYNQIINRNFLYLTRESSVINNINKAIEKRIDSSLEIKKDELYLKIDIKSIDTKYFDFLKGVFILISDITEIKNTQEVKKEFLTNAAHELKSPLTSIIGYNEMIQNKIITKKEEIINASIKTLEKANEMNMLVTDMLNLAYIEDNTTVFLKEKINVKDIILEIINNNKDNLKRKNIILNLDVKDYYYEINRNHLYLLISNLISNSIKYNKENGKIFISLNDNKFIIKDTGIGIKKENLKRVFERFYRENEARNDGGTGLGLAICKHVCILYDIKINIESEKDKYTEITLIF